MYEGHHKYEPNLHQQKWTTQSQSNEPVFLNNEI